jgi:predicted transposase YbfD/YdcC
LAYSWHVTNTTKNSKGPQDKDSTLAGPTGDEIALFEIGSLAEGLMKLQDRREARGKRYSLVTLITLLVLGKLAGEDRLKGIAEWAQLRTAALVEMLGLSYAHMPHVATFERLMRKGVSMTELEACVSAYFAEMAKQGDERQICMDGKQVRGTEGAEKQGNVYLLGGFLANAEVMLMQVEVQPGENELSAAPRLLRAMNLRGFVVSGDAAFAQRNLSLIVTRAGGEYVWKLKENQPKLLADVRQAFAPERPALPGFSNPPSERTSYTQTRTGHGRIECRTLTASCMLKGYSDWPNLEQVFMLETSVTCKRSGAQTSSVHYGITSLRRDEADPKRLLTLVNQQWDIESKSHWRRDVIFGEDFCGLRKGSSAHFMAIINNIAIALIANAGLDMTVPSVRRRFCARPTEALRRIHSPL